MDKRHVRRDRADVFATRTEGLRGAAAVDWGLVDEAVPLSRFADAVARRADAAVAASARAGDQGVPLPPLDRTEDGDIIRYAHVEARLDRAARRADILIQGPDAPPPGSAADAAAQGAGYYPLALARELDHLILHLRTNELDLGTWVFRTRGDAELVLAYDAQLAELAGALVRRRGLALPQAGAQAAGRHQPLPDRRSSSRAAASPARCWRSPWPATGSTCSTACPRRSWTASTRPTARQ